MSGYLFITVINPLGIALIGRAVHHVASGEPTIRESKDHGNVLGRMPERFDHRIRCVASDIVQGADGTEAGEL